MNALNFNTDINEITHVSDLILFALDRKIPVRLCMVDDGPYKDCLGVDINGVVIIEEWEVFESLIHENDKDKVKKIISMNNRKL